MAALPVFNPPIPFIGRMPGGFRPSFMIKLKGKIFGNGRGIIDFLNTPARVSNDQEIVFHISIRPQDKVIVRNDFQRGQWGQEERRGECIIKNKKTFEMVILAEFHTYKISVNGEDLGSFRHRLPLSWVDFIRVSGDMSIDYILFEQSPSSAEQQNIVYQVAAIPSDQATSEFPIQSPDSFHHSQPPPPYSQQDFEFI